MWVIVDFSIVVWVDRCDRLCVCVVLEWCKTCYDSVMLFHCVNEDVNG